MPGPSSKATTKSSQDDHNNTKSVFDVTIQFFTGLVSFTIAEWIVQTFPGDIIFGLVITLFVILWLYADRFLKVNLVDTITNDSWMEIWKYTLNFIKVTFIWIMARYWLDVVKTIWDSTGLQWYELITSWVFFFFLLLFYLLKAYTRKEMMVMYKQKFLHTLYYNVHFRKYANQDKVRAKLKSLRKK